MRSTLPLLLLLLLTACSSPPPRPVFADYIEVRQLETDDPLAPRFASRDGQEEYHLGDPLVSGKTVPRLQLKPGTAAEDFNLLITVTGVTQARWKHFARKPGKKAALVIDGKVHCIFDVQVPDSEPGSSLTVITVPGVATTQEEKEQLERFFDESREKNREAKEDE